MKLAVLGIDASRAASDQPTGTETYAARVIDSLIAAGHFRLRLYLRRKDAARIGWEHVEVVRVDPPRVWTHLGLAREVALHPPDVLFVPSHVMPGATRPPAVVTVHDLGHRAHPAAHTWRQVRYLEWTTRRHVHGARALVADSQSTKSDLVQWYGADPSRVVVAPLGVDQQFRPAESPARTAARTALGVGTRRYLLHVGTVQPRKNLDTLVRAFARIAGDHPDVDLVLAGRWGWGHADPIGRARLLGLEGRVRHVGYIDADLLPAAYSEAVATALPSWYEGFGLTALESMACGTPVVGANRSSIPEVVGDAGLLVDPASEEHLASALGRICSDAELRLLLADEGRARAARFTWAACAHGVETAVRMALEPNTVFQARSNGRRRQ